MQEMVHTKNIGDELKFKLLDIVRQENVVEELINYIIEFTHKISELDTLMDTIGELKRENKNFEFEVNRKDGTIQELRATLKEQERAKRIKIMKFDDYVTNFINGNNRYPSIDETWKAAWNARNMP